ncbi:phytanoyl-CoA dioxygenase [Rhodobacterales bacterium HKCCE2091]|nr:phytanoyl-CoA dioxygenase [Rhodobacterales bacterium HKCCE2091]
MTPSHRNGATPGQIRDFIDHGFLRLDNAFPADLARACLDALWARIGPDPHAPETWTEPVIRVPFMASEIFDTALNTPLLYRAYDALVGPGRWIPPRQPGGFAIRFPSDADPGDTGWHVDASFGEGADYMDWRANVTSRGRALLMLVLFSDTGPEDAPTRLRAGSHRIVARELLPHGEDGVSLRALAADGFATSASCTEIEATGAAGTVWLCHPFLVHAAQRHRGRRPRFMAQPALLPAGPFDPGLPPSPVQVAIREACGLAM